MRFEWICDGCGRRVADGKGYICADDRAAKKVMRTWDRFKREKAAEAEAKGEMLIAYPVSEMMGLPVNVNWRVWHRRCDPYPNRNDYWFAVERCRTLEQLLEWNAHLTSKPWVRYTDWARFIQRRQAPSPAMREAS